MVTKEFSDRAEYQAFVENPANQERIRAVSLYWYEGKGKRVTTALPGRHVNEYWAKLSLDQRIRQAFNRPPELMEAFRKDFEENGGMTEIAGEPQDAVMVVEYDETH